MTCTWCGLDTHQAFEHGGLVLRPGWSPDTATIGQPPFLPPGAHLVTITLTPDQVTRALSEAEASVANTWRRSMEQPREDVVAARAMGNRGEMALADYLGVPWKPTTRAGHRPDVALCHVRTTRTDPPLLMFRRDEVERPPRGPFVCVQDRDPTETLVGWTTLAWCARDIRTEVLKAGRGPVPFVRQGVLRPVLDLITTHRSAAGLPPAGVGSR